MRNNTIVGLLAATLLLGLVVGLVATPAAAAEPDLDPDQATLLPKHESPGSGPDQTPAPPTAATPSMPFSILPPPSLPIAEREAASVTHPPALIATALVTQVAKLTASDGAAEDYFGFAAAVDGDTAVVGAYEDDDDGDNSGAAYLFERDQGGPDNWGQVTKLTAADAVASGQFGWSVAIQGDMVVVGAPGDTSQGPYTGAVYIFERDQGGPGNWGQVAKLTAADAAAQDLFGYAVTLDGDTVVVGARFDDDNGTDSGSAYVFERDQGGPDNWGQVAKLTASDGAAGDLFGFAVTIDGDTAVVGAIWDDDNGTDSGSAYVFERDQGGPDNWGQAAKLTAADGAAGDVFGYGVALRVDTLAIGAPADDDDGADSGSAYVFERDQGGPDNWGQVGKLSATDAAAGTFLGHHVALDGDTLVAGAPLASGAAPTSGAAYAYARDQGGAGNWGQIAKLAAGDGAQQDRFGFVVGLSGDTIVVGAPYDDDNGAYSGSAYVYHLEYTPPRPDLAVVKTANPAIAAPGEPLTYILIFSNTGVLTATGVVLTDVVPGELRGISYASRGVAITPTGALSYSWLVADLIPGAGGAITITGLLAPDLPCGHVFTNTARISAAMDITPTNNSSDAPVTVRAVYSLTVEPPAGADSGDPGLDVVYTLAVTNTGNCADVFDVAVNHLWPAAYPATIGPLGAREGVTMNVTVTVPLGTTGGDGDAITLTLTSQGDGTVSASSALTTTANQVAPVLDPIADQTVTVSVPLTLTVTASDANGDSLAFSLDAGAPEGASIDPGTGVFAWTPTEAQAGAYTVTVRVADDGVPPLDDSSSFAITVESPMYRIYLPLVRKF